MIVWNVAAQKPPLTIEQILEILDRASRPTLVRFSPAVKAGVAIGMNDDDNGRVIVCSWDDLDRITDAIRSHGDGHYQIDGGVS